MQVQIFLLHPNTAFDGEGLNYPNGPSVWSGDINRGDSSGPDVDPSASLAAPPLGRFV